MDNNENLNNQVNENNNVQEEKKNNSKTIGFVILIIGLLLIGVAVYKLFIEKPESDKPKDDNTQENGTNDTSKINAELKDAISFAIKDQNKLVALTASGTEVLIYDFSNSNIKYNENTLSFQSSLLGDVNYDYDVNENVLYLFLYTTTSDKYIASIDLTKGNGNYNPEIVAKIDLTNTELSGMDSFGGAYIAKVGNSIYFSNKSLFKYDLQTKQIENMNITSDGRVMWVLKYNSNIIYNSKNDIYVLDISSKKSTHILSNGTPTFIYNNSLIYYYTGENSGTDKINEETDERYYSYDFGTSSKQQVTKFIGIGDLYKEYIIPSKTGLYSFNKLILYRYNNALETVHEFTCDDFKDVISECTTDKLNIINNFVKISENEFLLEFGDNYEGEVYNVIYNISTNKVTASNGREVGQYNMEYYLK